MRPPGPALAVLVLAGACAAAPAPAAKLPLARDESQIEALRTEYLQKLRASMAAEDSIPAVTAPSPALREAPPLPASAKVVEPEAPAARPIEPLRAPIVSSLEPQGPPVPPAAKAEPGAPPESGMAVLGPEPPCEQAQPSLLAVPEKVPDETELRRSLVRVLEARLAAGDSDPDLKRRLALEYLALDRPLEARQTMDGLGRQDLVSMFTRAAGLVHLGEIDEALPVVAELHRRLESEATLLIGELAFCRRVRGYGDLEKMRPAFKPNDRGLLYVPVLHYACREQGGVWRVGLDLGLSIRDANGLVVWERPQQHRVSHETQSYQPTFFLPVPLRLPAYLPPGTYSLRVSVRDLQKNQDALGDLEFRIE